MLAVGTLRVGDGGVRPVRVAIIGWGGWGPRLGRSVVASAHATLAAVVDSSPARLSDARAHHPHASVSTCSVPVLSDPAIDAVVIATPARTHCRLGLEALAHGKHVLVEKPMACSSAEARLLVEASQRRGLVLMVDHTFLFSPPVRVIRRLLAAGELGELRYYHADRLSFGIARSDVNVLWDVAVHDLALLDALVASPPRSVQAVGGGTPEGERPPFAHLSLEYESGVTAHLHASWAAPVKTRRVTIGGSKATLVYDDLDAAARVRVFECAVDALPMDQFSPPGAARAIPVGDETEPLRAVVDEFLGCIAEGRRPASDGASGLRVVRQLEAADRSFAMHGARVAIDGPGPPS